MTGRCVPCVHMKKQPQHGTRVEIADNLELAVAVGNLRLCARISPATARRLAGVLLELARENSRRTRSAAAADSLPPRRQGLRHLGRFADVE